MKRIASSVETTMGIDQNGLSHSRLQKPSALAIFQPFILNNSGYGGQINEQLNYLFHDHEVGAGRGGLQTREPVGRFSDVIPGLIQL